MHMADKGKYIAMSAAAFGQAYMTPSTGLRTRMHIDTRAAYSDTHKAAGETHIAMRAPAARRPRPPCAPSGTCKRSRDE